jgi:hypothetical protein
LKEFGLKKNNTFVSVSGKITIFLGEDKRRKTVL